MAIADRISFSPTPAHHRWIFLLVLATLHLVFVLGPASLVGRWLFLSHVGLFLLWQPFVQPKRRLPLAAALLVVALAAIPAYLLHWGILLMWTMLLCGVVGGKVFVFPDRWERLFHLAALGYLVTACLVLILPAALQPVRPTEPLLAGLVLYLAPLIFVFMAILPAPFAAADERAEIVDFVYGVFVFLLLGVLVLGSLAYTLLFRAGLIEAQLATLAVVAGVLLLLGLIWNPRAGFAGLGAAVAQHVMSLGLPVEEWLQSLAALSRREEDPRRFLALACAELPVRLPGVQGGRWCAHGAAGSFGQQEGCRTEFEPDGLEIELVTRQEPSPALRWHYDLVVRLLAEFYFGKWRAQELKRLSYVEAIHETGARLTHDVKNLLQSLDTLCAAANETGTTVSPRFGELLRRQLPEISARLRQTLDKLVRPGRVGASALQSAQEWLAGIERRFAGVECRFEIPGDAERCQIAEAQLFTSVAENLLQNIAVKRSRETQVHATLSLHCAAGEAISLEVVDDGSAIPTELAERLLRQHVPSQTGLGIGLYQCARQAAAAGWQLALVENRPGAVRFRLSRAP